MEAIEVEKKPIAEEILNASETVAALPSASTEIPPSSAPTDTPPSPAPTDTPPSPAPTDTPPSPAPTEQPPSPAPTEIPVLPPLQADTPQTGGHIIAIDAGHQAKGNKEKEPLGPGSEELKAKVSSGTRGVATGIYEYELNLTIAQALKAELEARGYTIVMIRDSHDVDISNKERAETANTSGAEIFLRIHANGSENSSVHGTLTICNTASSPYNPGIHDESLRLAQEVLAHMVELMGSKDRGVWETDTMSGINWCTIPVTIIEMGYMSNEDEDRLMQEPDYQNRIVQGIADGVDAYFQ
ncbi:MAG: N-acetylmuramoyl-L-alanine amidase [Acetatifactor sp.]|nr:N-acetylmuramoyl-L-alanine amidase [Acetatifactor sp.]